MSIRELRREKKGTQRILVKVFTSTNISFLTYQQPVDKKMYLHLLLSVAWHIITFLESFAWHIEWLYCHIEHKHNYKKDAYIVLWSYNYILQSFA